MNTENIEILLKILIHYNQYLSNTHYMYLSEKLHVIKINTINKIYIGYFKKLIKTTKLLKL